MVMVPVISLPVARHVLWYQGDANLGQDGGHFVNRVLAAASAADEANLAKLRTGWPELIHAWEKATRESWGLDWLRALVKDFEEARDMGLEFALDEAVEL